jgi:hypothetical protein
MGRPKMEQMSWQSSCEEETEQGCIYYVRRAPTYGTYKGCWATGPSSQPCQECDNGQYTHLALKDYILDSQTVWMKNPHHTARAGLTYNMISTDTMKFDRKAVKTQLLQDFNVEHPFWKDNPNDYQFTPHQRSYEEREVVTDFFKEYKDLLNVKHI